MDEGTPELSSREAVRIDRWPSEQPLLVAVALVSLALWALLAISIIGLIYALMIGAFLFLAHVGFVAHIRGNAVRLGPDQFPELHARVVELSRRAGLKTPPEAYLLQAGGSLNALATRFLGSGLIVLFSDLLDACGDDEAARDMIVAHELGHLAAGHLDARWLLFPGLVVPFLGSAYSQACEYTCDRYGAALCGRRESALVGLGILAAGGAYGHRVDFAALARQRELLNTGWMTLGRWLMSHPPLCLRVAAIEPALLAGSESSRRGPLTAVAILAALMLVPAAGGAAVALIFGAAMFQRVTADLEETGALALPEDEFEPPRDVAAASDRARDELAALGAVVRAQIQSSGHPPADHEALVAAWFEQHGETEMPLDPFDGLHYGYDASGEEFQLWSSGPDGESGTEDDIHLQP